MGYKNTRVRIHNAFRTKLQEVLKTCRIHWTYTDGQFSEQFKTIS